MDHRAEHPFPDIAWFSECIKCGLVVEPYHPERVLWQFGYIQTIPPRPFTPPRPNRSNLLEQYWERWIDHILTDQSRGRRCQYSGSGESVAEYMAWYDRISHIASHRSTSTAEIRFYDRCTIFSALTRCIYH